MSQPTAIQPKFHPPEPLYIADKREGFLNWLADVLVERIITEVDQEQAAKEESKTQIAYENIPCNP